MESLIIFGGSFDPIHNGHIKMASVASLQYGADVVFVPSKTPRWKEVSESIDDRLNMLKIAIKECLSSSFYIDDYEINSRVGEINYSIDTVRYFKTKYPNKRLYFLIGGDQVNKFHNWKEAMDIATLTKIIFFRRKGETINEENVFTYHMEEIKGHDIDNISSTNIRNLQQISIPLGVRQYIEEHRLYYVKRMEKYISNERLKHSIQVANLAYLIAAKNALADKDKAYVAGLLHDIGKLYPLNKDKELEFMKKHYPQYLDLPEFSYHQFIGVEIARQEFKIDDAKILQAIEFHSTGRANMGPLDMIVYSADKIEPTRGFDSTWLIKSCYRNYVQGFIDTVTDNKKYLLAHNKDIRNKLTDECFKMYIKEDK